MTKSPEAFTSERNGNHNGKNRRSRGVFGRKGERHWALPSADSALGSVRYEKVDFLYPQACVPTCVGNFLSPMCEIFVVTGFLDLINFVVTVF